jgi:hypothetical protein
MNIEEMKARFTSGNSVPVERAYLTKDEFDRLLRVVEISYGVKNIFHTNPDPVLTLLIEAIRDFEQS